MRLMLLRHAKSMTAEPGMLDRERHLAPRGVKDALRIGAYMALHGLLPAHAIVSAARRTRETWEHLVGTFPKPSPASFVEELYNARMEHVLDAIKEADPSRLALLVIGHNPGLHDIARALIAAGDVEARERLNEGLPTSGLAVIDFPGSDWSLLPRRGGRLDRFVTPRSLTAATD